ncbi:MAG: hypothetical protein ACFB5Z_13775 [Elainellaceae cyanobacterium]
MDARLSSVEIQQAQQVIHRSEQPEVAEMEAAIASLQKHDGDLEASFQELWREEVGSLGAFGPGDKSLWEVTLRVLRQEICGDEGFRSKILDYNKNPGSASILTGAIVSLVELTTLPIGSGIATVVVLYILKVGLNIFCEYTEPGEVE